jgi:hypothetical protein
VRYLTLKERQTTTTKKSFDVDVGLPSVIDWLKRNVACNETITLISS